MGLEYALCLRCMCLIEAFTHCVAFPVPLKQVTTLPWHFTPKGALYGPIYGIYVG